ncbi:MAG: tyrosine-type recombinase/integrase [Sedimenticola sp.]
MNNLNDPTQNYLVVRMLEGFHRIKKTPDTRVPIMYNTLAAICTVLHQICFSQYEVILFKAVYTLAFFGLFRVSELVVSSQLQADRPLFITDVEIMAGARQIGIRLRKSKTNQRGAPTMVNVFAIDSPCCPVRALQALLIRRPKSVYLFCHQDGKPLTRYQFGAVLAKATVTLKLPKANYQTHSFRIGAASWLAQKGVADSVIKKLGRWQSNAFKRYIRS